LGVSPDAVQTIMHGIELAGHNEAAPRIASQPATRTRHHIGTIGRYEERKGHETLIRAMVPVLEEFPDAQLKIAGHDPWRYGNVLRRMIAELRLESHVHLVGYMSDRDAFFSDIDVFAFASLSEGFGIVLLEAMAAGKPSVVSAISPLTDIIVPGTSGLVARRDDPEGFANAIKTLFRNRAYMEHMGAEAHKRVISEFSQARMIENTLAFYRDVIARSGSAAAV
jgi:glycosyltransferase involved in cell wall biosynthesis